MSHTAELPQAIQSFLREYIRQRNRMLFWRGATVLAICLVGWVMLCALVDRGWQLGAGVRLALLAVTVLGFGAWWAKLLRETLLARVELNAAALELEYMRPDLDERLATVCSRLRDVREGIASPALLGALAEQVEEQIGQDGAPRLVSMATLGRHAISAAVVMVAVVVVSLMPLVGMPRLLKRTLLPWTQTPPVTTTYLEPLYTRPNIDALEGEATIIGVLADRVGKEGVVLKYTTDGKTWDTRALECVGPYQYQAVLPATASQQRFVVMSGDAATEPTTITVLRKPAVAEFRMRYEYPEYMGREALNARNSDGLIEAPVGTKVTVTVVATEKLSAAVLGARDFQLPLGATIDPTVVEGTFTVSKGQPYQVQMVSAKGLNGTGPAGSQIRAIPDQAPFVQLVAPAEDVRLSPRDITQVRYQVADDYGLSGVALKLQVNNSQPVEVAVRAATGAGSAGDVRRRDGEEELDLATLGLKVGDVVGITVVARDGAGQSGSSGTRYVFVSPHSVAAGDYARMSDLQRALESTKALGKEVTSAVRALDQFAGQRNNPEKAGEAIASYQQHIAESGQYAEALKQSLSRAITRSPDVKTSDLLANMADRAHVRMIEAHDLIDEPNRGEARELNAKQRLQRSAEQTKQMEQQLEALLGGERAAAALADRRNLQAARQAQAAGKMTTRANEMLDRMQQDVADQTRQLGLNPDDPNVEGQLKWKSEQAANVAKGAKNVDLPEAAQSWADQLMDQKVHPPMFDRRLSAAADVESLRPDADLQRAADLNLASRAAQAIWLMSQDPQNRATADRARREFVQAFADLEKQQARAEGTPDQERAKQARQQLAQFAGEADDAAPAGPSDPRMRDLAMEANAEMANRRYDRASELQRRMALEQQQAIEAAEALREAQQADELAQMQQALREELQASQAEAMALAQRQREVARRIAAQMGEAEEPAAGAPKDSRREAMAAIQAVQERLAQMPQQLQDATRAADVQMQAHGLTARVERDAANASPERKAAAERTLERAKLAETDAVKQTRQSLLPVDPDVAKVLSANLSDFLPETTRATQVLDTKLTPSLEQVKQAATENKAQDLVRGVRQVRDAIAQAQQELRDAQAKLMERDPLYAARVYAEQAARALSKVPPDVEGAKANQQLASEALSRQWSQSIREAAAAHLSASGQFNQIYSAEAPVAAKAGVKTELSAARQWGMLRERQGQELSATAREEDPGGYQKMLQVYFRTLGKATATEGAKP